MIAYEELERALARWKARRSGTVETETARDPDKTPSGTLVRPPSPSPRDQTHEVDLVDADLDE